MKVPNELLNELNGELSQDVTNESEMLTVLDQVILKLQTYRNSLTPMSASQAFGRLQQVANELENMSKSSTVDLDMIVPLVGDGLAAETVIRGVISRIESQLAVISESRK